MSNSTSLTVKIQSLLMPDYYPEFACTASQCHESCCCNWTIGLTKNDYKRLRRACASHPDLQKRFESGVKRLRGADCSDKNYAQFVLADGACQFLNKDGLCALQSTCGAQALPSVCREFPRYSSHTPSGLQQHSCSVGCEAVLQLLLKRPEGLGFLQESLDQPQNRIFDNCDVFKKNFGDIQALCIDILQDRQLPLPRRVLLLGLVLRDMVELQASDQEVEVVVSTWLAQKRALVSSTEVHQLIKQFEGNGLLFVFNNIKQLFPIASTIPDICQKCFSLVELQQSSNEMNMEINFSAYETAAQKFFDNYAKLDYFFENILVNIFFHYRYPFFSHLDNIWQAYVNFCTIYSCLHFTTICCCYDEYNQDKLLSTISQVSRALLHSPAAQKGLTAELIENKSSTLADMAILVCG